MNRRLKIDTFVCLYVFVGIVLVLGQEARIVVPPMAINISLYEEAIFKCVAVAHHINWKANNTPLNAISDKGFTGSAVTTPVNAAENLYSSQLRVTGSHFSNASEIVCIASLFVMDKFTIATSEPILLLVQGPLDAVTDLSTDLINSSVLYISWNPPYSLDGVAILNYNIKISNSLNVTIKNTTDYYYSIDPTQTETNIVVTVIPVNKAGKGIATSVGICALFDKGTVISTTSLFSTFIPVTMEVAKTKQSYGYMHSYAQTPYASSVQDTRTNSSVQIIFSVCGVSVLICMLTTVVGLICTATCVVKKRKSEECKPDTVLMTQDNPAYDYVHNISKIVTQKNAAYEDVTKLKNMNT